MEKRQSFQQMLLGYWQGKKNESRYRPYTHPQNNRKWITEINAKHKSIKFLKDNRGENVDNPAYSDDFLDNTSEAQSMKEIIDKLNLIKI